MTRSTEGFWINKPVEAVRNKRLNDFAWDIISRAMRAGLDENLAENLGVFVRQLIDAREFIKDEKAEREFCDNLGELAGLLVNLRRRIQDAEKMLAAAIAGNNALEMMIADTEKYYLDELRRHQDAYDYCREQARQLGNDLPIKIFDPMSFSDLPPLADLPRPFGFSVSENSRLPHPKRQYRLKLVSAIENMALQRGLWPELASELVLVVQDYFVGYNGLGNPDNTLRYNWWYNNHLCAKHSPPTKKPRLPPL